MSAKETAYNAIKKLVEKFGDQIENYKSNSYNETLTRRDFIDPFFDALGWDINNKQDVWESYREVIHEDRIKIGGVMKAPDYSFRLQGGNRLFFVEAKKPMVSIKDDVNPAYQIRLYGYNAKLSVSIVTDFEEFAVYDCSKKPKKTDKPSVARVEYFKYTDYLEKFDFIWDTFGREQVIKGGLVKYARAEKKGTATVDKDFLQSLDEWRTLLAANIYKNNDLTEDELNYAVQQTIDRLIFLRFAEDRGIEQYANLKGCLIHANHYVDLVRLFKLADQRYNSGLFHFNKEKENTAPEDTITGTLVIDNKTIRSIINGLYDNDYLFNVIPVEILGSAYEQFLGKQISITGSKAIIEDKPEVRKAGGVYYTPQYIVDYIVQQTVGKLCEGKTPTQVSKLKVVDPACGSGSFLLGAYQYLLNWHLDYYKQEGENPKKKSKVLTPDGNLSTEEKKRILLNNIYGVDIDTNAVEVTKLSLLLKCMEGETVASITKQTSLLHYNRVLPSLENNIKSGNSLIDLDYYDGEIDYGSEKKIKPFNWQQNFPEVFKQGGFDTVIGNPPYVRQELFTTEKPYYQRKYKTYHGVADLYTYFIENSFSLLKPKGYYSIIVANKWMRANYGEPLRKWLKEKELIEIIDFGDLPVFESATTYPCIIVATNNIAAKYFDVTNAETLDFDSLTNYVLANKVQLEQNGLDNGGWNLVSDTEKKLLEKLNTNGIALESYVKGKVYRGVLTGLNEAFVIDEETRERLIREDNRSAEVIKPFLAGRDIKRYQKPSSDKYLIFTKRGININDYPAIKNYLQQFKKQLMPKPKGHNGEWEGRKQGSYQWYEIQDAVDYFKEFEEPKIIYPNILKQPEFTYDTEKWFTNQKCFIISLDDKYLLGVLNSKLNYYLFEKYLPKLRGGFYEPSYVFFKNFPIRKIDLNNKSEKSQHDEVVKLVNQMLQLNVDLQNSTLPAQQEQLKQRIQYTDNKINQLVYQLYNLTEEEIKIVEGN